MEEINYSSPPSNTSTTNATAAGKREKETSATSRIKKDCLAFGVSLQEGFRYIKAMVVGQGKKLKAGNEEEAAAAELQAQKMQVEAADEAENTKKRIYKSI